MHGSSGGQGTTSTLKVFGNIFISFIGAGVLGLPYAFKEAGILEGIIIMSTVGLLSVRAMLLIIDSKDRISSGSSRSAIDDAFTMESETALLPNGSTKKLEKTRKADNSHKEICYGDVGYEAYGRLGANVVDGSIVVSQVGFCCAYLIFITENIAQYFTSYSPEIDGEHEPGSNAQKIVLASLFVPLCFLCFLKHLHKLAIFSLFADFANVFAYTIVFWFDFEHAGKVRMHPKEMDIAGLPFFAGIAIYCYEGAGMVLSLESSMAKEVRNQFRTIFKWTMLLITTLYIIFGVCGYMSFGPETNPIITLNLPTGIFPFLVKGCLCFSLFFTFPVMMFPVIQILEKRIGLENSPKKGKILRSTMVLLTVIIVLLIPSFADLMSLVGATCCSLIAFIMPAMFHLKLFQGDLTRSQILLDYFLILLGITGTIIGTFDSLKRMGIIPSGHVESGGTHNVTVPLA
uniref:amino acid transporter AVT3B-like n=1 Tax=Styela clava TaxID=7725 RepID=UPI00193947A6|nr:amino acid transporter AVT3B-like [Styela clava]